MREFEKKDFGKLLKAGALEARRWMRATSSDTARIYDRNLEGVPVTVELYGKWAKIVDYSPEGMGEDDVKETIDIVNRMAYVEKDKIVFQRRKKREGLEQHSLQSEESVSVTVSENGLSFEVDLTGHVDTGLFLDQSGTRAMVREMSAGRKVLNLFSYTGSFSVYAAAGGAESVTSVDMSNTYSAAARRNLEANGFLSEEKYPVVVSDCLPFVEKALSEGRKWDIVIFDPPAFSNSHKMEKPFDVQRDYLRWIWMLSGLLDEGGVLIFSVNLGTFALDKKTLKKSFKVNELTQELAAPGFVRSKGGQSRIWVLEKVAPMKEPGPVRIQRRTSAPRLDKRVSSEYHDKEREDMREVRDEDLERLTLSMDSQDSAEDGDKAREAKPRQERGSDRRREGGRPRRDDRRGEGDRPRYSDDRRDGYRRNNDRDGYRPRWNDDRRDGYRRDNDRDGYRPRYNDDRRDGYRRSNDRDGYRPRWNDDRRDSYRRNDRDDYRPRWNDERRGGYDRDPRPRYGKADDNRKAPWQEKRDRARKSVKPYGYDNIRNSRKRDDKDEEDF